MMKADNSRGRKPPTTLLDDYDYMMSVLEGNMFLIQRIFPKANEGRDFYETLAQAPTEESAMLHIKKHFPDGTKYKVDYDVNSKRYTVDITTQEAPTYSVVHVDDVHLIEEL